MPIGEGVPEVPGGFPNDRMRDGAASRDVGLGAAHLRGEAGF